MLSDDRASRPIAGLLLFVTISAALVHLAGKGPLHGSDQEIEVGTNNTEIRAPTEEEAPGELFALLQRTKCVMTLGLAEIVGDPCQEGFAGVLDKLKGLTVVQTVTQGLGDLISLLTTLATFNIKGAPGFIRYIMGTTITGIVAYVIVLVVRGVG